MATLAAQIQTDLGVLLPDETLEDLTRQRSSTSSEDTTITQRASELAAAKVKSKLGSVDGTDTQAVDIGVRIAINYLTSKYSLVLQGAQEDTYATLIGELDELRNTRIAENATGKNAAADNDRLNKLYPHSTWADDND